ncbi:MAG: hypothetical protein ACTSYI_07120, partial [Promethearchaeota archaeon]
MPKSKFLITLSILLTVFLISGLDCIDISTQNHFDQHFESDHMNTPIVAEGHVPILISGNADLATFISTEGLNGQGTLVDPYVIEDYGINAISAHGIHVQNTDDYLIIQNCTIVVGYDLYTGIYLSNVTNAIVRDNSLQNNK